MKEEPCKSMTFNEEIQQHERNITRTFLGIGINSVNTNKLQSIISCLQQNKHNHHIGWQSPDKLHITLRFLGATPITKIPMLIESFRLAIAHISPFKIHLGKIALFPSIKKSRYIVVDIGPMDNLKEMVSSLEEAAIAAGFAKEERSFRAHLTLGKIYQHSKPQINKFEFPLAMQWVSEIYLYESLPDLHSTRYHVLAVIPLLCGDR